MPTYQPKVSTKHVDYPCRECGQILAPNKMWITGIDGNNAAITKNAVRNPICQDCLTKQKAKEMVNDLWKQNKTTKQ